MKNLSDEVRNMRLLSDLIEKVDNEEYITRSAVTGETNPDFLLQFYDLFLDNDLDGIAMSKERQEFLKKLNYHACCGIMSDEPCYCEQSIS